MSNARQQPIHIFINRTKYDVDNPTQTGGKLKELAAIPLADVLFLKQPGEDMVIPNHGETTLKNGDHLYSSPPADYGSGATAEATVAADTETLAGVGSGESGPLPMLHRQADGWTYAVFEDYRVPDEFTPSGVAMLIKLPPLFPAAAPDMFWVRPALCLRSGGEPRSTSTETINGEQWQRFSWHLKPGAWQPGLSGLADFLRCVRARFETRV